MEHCNWHFYDSSLRQTCFVIFFTISPVLKSPKQVFFNPINIFDILLHTLYLLFFNILFCLTSKYFYSFYVNNARWSGVPFIMKAGKALNARKCEIRIQFKSPPGSEQMFGDSEVPKNELVIRVQPNDAIYFKMNVKTWVDYLNFFFELEEFT